MDYIGVDEHIINSSDLTVENLNFQSQLDESTRQITVVQSLPDTSTISTNCNSLSKAVGRLESSVVSPVDVNISEKNKQGCSTNKNSALANTVSIL